MMAARIPKRNALHHFVMLSFIGRFYTLKSWTWIWWVTFCTAPWFKNGWLSLRFNRGVSESLRSYLVQQRLPAWSLLLIVGDPSGSWTGGSPVMLWSLGLLVDLFFSWRNGLPFCNSTWWSHHVRGWWVETWMLYWCVFYHLQVQQLLLLKKGLKNIWSPGTIKFHVDCNQFTTVFDEKKLGPRRSERSS